MKTLLLSLIKFYKRIISPFLGNNCRFYPSCSEYMKLSIENCGALKGFAYGIWRILRCNPFSEGGIDDAPKCDCN
jgi:putative membrane protein insertion efficiency factor